MSLNTVSSPQTPPRPRPSGTSGRDIVAAISVTALAVVGLRLIWSLLNRTDVIADFWTVASFVPLLVLGLTLLFWEIRRRPYSLHLMHLLSLVGLMGLVPLMQLIGGSFPWQATFPVTEDGIVTANLVVLVWLYVYLIGYHFGGRMASTRMRLPWLTTVLDRPLAFSAVKLGLGIAVIAMAFLAYQNLGGVFTRSALDASLRAPDSALDLLVRVFLRAIPLMALGALLLVAGHRGTRRSSGTTLVLIIFAIAVLWFDNPLAGARYWTATMVIAFGAILVLRRRKTGGIVVVVLVLGTVLLPTLDAGRLSRDPSSIIFALADAPDPVDQLASSGDFDSYVNSILINEFVSERGTTYGRQLLGVFLFWVPRSLGANNPVGSSTYVATELGFSHTNIALSLHAEGVINFGWLGVPMFAVVFGLILGYFDKIYHVGFGGFKGSRPRVIDLLYVFWLGMIVFITRGGLMSSFSYTVGITLAGLVVVAWTWLGPTATKVRA